MNPKMVVRVAFTLCLLTAAMAQSSLDPPTCSSASRECSSARGAQAVPDNVDLMQLKILMKTKAKQSDQEPDENGCYDKGEYGYWCPDGKGGWFDKKSGKTWREDKEQKEEHKEEKDEGPDKDGCYDKGEHGYWCPDGKGGWFDKHKEKNKEEHKKEKDEGPGKDGCYDKGDDGYWCPDGKGGWFDKHKEEHK